jgi:hypothetical protein
MEEGVFRDLGSMEKDLYEFEDLLKTNDILIKKGSVLEEVVLSLQKFNYIRANLVPYDESDSREEWRQVVGLHDMFIKLMRIKDHPSFMSLLPHLRLLNDSKFMQNTKSSILDQNANKIYELLMASLAMRISDEVSIDDPDCSKGNNPDIIFAFKGELWTIACKVLHTDSSLTFWERLEEGIEQIEKSRAKKGFVSFNFKNILPHDEMLPVSNPPIEEDKEIIYGAFPNEEIPKYRLAVFCDNKALRIGCDIGNHGIISTFRGVKASPIAFNYIHTTTLIEKDISGQIKPVPTSLGFFQIMPFLNIIDSDTLSVVGLLNHVAQSRTQ